MHHFGRYLQVAECFWGPGTPKSAAIFFSGRKNKCARIRALTTPAGDGHPPGARRRPYLRRINGTHSPSTGLYITRGLRACGAAGDSAESAPARAPPRPGTLEESTAGRGGSTVVILLWTGRGGRRPPSPRTEASVHAWTESAGVRPRDGSVFYIPARGRNVKKRGCIFYIPSPGTECQKTRMRFLHSGPGTEFRHRAGM